MQADFLEQLREASLRAERTRARLKLYMASTDLAASESSAPSPSTSGSPRPDILAGLANVSKRLSDGYVQVYADLEDEDRISYAGTAHEIREVLSTLLRELAPGDAVKAEPDYKPVPNTSGPTQKQRVQYIMRQHRAGSKESEVVEVAARIEDWIGDLTRAIYSRGSDAAHRGKDRAEVVHILGYFEPLVHDLLNLG